MTLLYSHKTELNYQHNYHNQLIMYLFTKMKCSRNIASTALD